MALTLYASISRLKPNQALERTPLAEPLPLHLRGAPRPESSLSLHPLGTMNYVVAIFLFSTALVSAVVFFSAAVAGLRRGRVFYEPSCPPIPFRARPLAFLALCLFYFAASGTFAVGAVRVAAHILAAP